MLEKVQGAATSSLFSPPLFQGTWPVYSSCMRSAMLHASETWPLTKPNLQRLQRNNREKIRLICNGKKSKRKVQGMPQSQIAALPRHQEEEETDKSKQAQIDQTYEKH